MGPFLLEKEDALILSAQTNDHHITWHAFFDSAFLSFFGMIRSQK
jgi:hypothetical protein